jgi:hypothetical protein
MEELELSLNKRQSTIFYKGFGIIEAVVGIALASVFLTAFATLTMQTIKLNRANINELKADMYLKELIEVAKDLEQSDWPTIANSSCTNLNYLKIEDGKWNLNSEPDLNIETEVQNDGYTRSIKIENVCRDQRTREILSTGCDPILCDLNLIENQNTKKIIAKIIWNDGTHSPMTLETYIYNYNTTP